MKSKEDIGKVVEQQLKELDATLSNDVWNQINTSLENEKRKRKRKGFFFWLSGGVIGVLIGLLLSQVTTENSNSNVEILEKKTEINSTKSDQNNIGKELKDLFATMEFDTTGTSFKVLKAVTLSDASMNNDSLNTITTIKRKLQNNTYWIEESNSTKTKYYYYNDSTKQSIEIENPKVIDSILRTNPKKVDSVMNLKEEN